MICAAAKGFLTQSDCGSPAATACSHCGRPMCTAHLSPASGFSMCYDCAATQKQQQGEEGEAVEPDYDDTWAHGYRASYYSSSGYRPHGSTSSTYDSTDARSFDQQGGEEFDEDERGGGFDAS
ncbi:MAG TPA: hypothetical protein VF432_05300 [Thermoanaerobaculia bacterium]